MLNIRSPRAADGRPVGTNSAAFANGTVAKASVGTGLDACGGGGEAQLLTASQVGARQPKSSLSAARADLIALRSILHSAGVVNLSVDVARSRCYNRAHDEYAAS